MPHKFHKAFKGLFKLYTTQPPFIYLAFLTFPLDRELEILVDILNLFRELEILVDNLNLFRELEILIDNLNMVWELEILVDNLNMFRELEILVDNLNMVWELEILVDSLNLFRELEILVDNLNLFRELEILVDNLNAGRPQCPVGLNTLVVPRKNSQNVATSENQPYVYLNCGHVQVSKSFFLYRGVTRGEGRTFVTSS